MPHDTHTTHESNGSWPDRVGCGGDDSARADGADDIHRQPTLLMFGSFAPTERELAPPVN